MKYLMVFIVIHILLSSCATSFSTTEYALGNNPAPTQPFVQLQNGQKFTAKNVQVRSDSVIAGQKGFAKKDIAFYSDGVYTFGKLRNHKFAIQTAKGDVNIYSYTSSHPYRAKGSGAIRHYFITKDYVQKSGSNDIRLFDYHSVKKIMRPGDAGYEYMRLYKRNRLVWNLGFFGGMAAEFTGVGIGANPRGSQAIANTLVFAGVCSVLTSAVGIVLNNRSNVQKAVAKHNHMIK